VAVTETEIKNVAKEAVREFLLALGVNVATPDAVIELQKDFHHVRSSRLTARAVRNEIGSKIISILTGSAVTGVIAAVTYYVAHH
jgi:hypothetical protein